MANEGWIEIHATGNYVQVRYPYGQRWIAVAVSDTRDAVTRVAADAYRNLANDRGQTPRQVRVVSATQLRREGGEPAIVIAEADIVSRADRGR
jgi:hypothetical protein